MHSREQLEERMGIVLSQMVERQRQIRAARHAEGELEKLREELLNLAHQYATTEEPPQEIKTARIVGRR